MGREACGCGKQKGDDNSRSADEDVLQGDQEKREAGKQEGGLCSVHSFISNMGCIAGKRKTFTRCMMVHAVSKGLASPTGVAWSRSRVGLATVLTECGPAAGQSVATPLYVESDYTTRRTLSTAIGVSKARCAMIRSPAAPLIQFNPQNQLMSLKVLDKGTA